MKTAGNTYPIPAGRVIVSRTSAFFTGASLQVVIHGPLLFIGEAVPRSAALPVRRYAVKGYGPSLTAGKQGSNPSTGIPSAGLIRLFTMTSGPSAVTNASPYTV
jgi:hypothetical protein